MAAMKESPERAIPVFTVLKSGNLFKNIFLLDDPSLILEPNSSKSDENGEVLANQRGEEEILIVGRHPDCNIVLEHPSISRFHLRIHSKPSSKKLWIVDLSSAHGTWVSDRKIEAQVRVELNEGDTMRFGTSTRVYRLHWIPLSRAFDAENPFFVFEDSKTQTESIQDADDDEQDEEFQFENQISFFEEHGQFPSAPPMPENMDPFTQDNEVDAEMLHEKENQSPSRRLNETDVLSMMPEPVASQSVNSSCLPDEKELLESTVTKLDKESEDNSDGDFVQRELSEREIDKSPKRASEQELNMPILWSRRGKTNSLIRIQTSRTTEKNRTAKKDVKISLGKENDGEDGNVARVLFCELNREEEMFTPDKENFTPGRVLGSSSMKKGKLEEIKQQKSAAASQDEDELIMLGSYSEKENMSPVVLRGTEPKKHSELKPTKPTSDCNQDHEEGMLGFSDKENTPLVFHGSRLKKSFGLKPMKLTIDCNQDPEEGMLAFSEKENLTPIVLRESKSTKPLGSRGQVRQEMEMIMSKRRVGRLPFQSLISNSPSKSKSEAPVAAGSSISVNCSQTVENGRSTSSFSMPKRSAVEAYKVWNMVVDTDCLLNKESRRSIQLLQGLKSTCLIIPRMVIRELDCLKRRSMLFRRDTVVSSVLQWIEECMVTTNWWIHVQNFEEDIPVAPTPPASPRLWTSEESAGVVVGSMPFSNYGSLQEIVSPTAEDHILDTALLFKRIKRNQRLILLTNSVSLKIKAMAEGLICETPEEFRESIVNPWSERFMWAESTPRGATWSCSDEAVLKEMCHSKRTARATEPAKGLKLILLHNSHYGQMR
ncbi:hypothetical protein Scep_008000 [Stephania cephalantha]|uniref:FHA domain-containing protein n=1 Tax=Stephania cephalantha TaxID=152367 RepID=A0AAP0PLN0_9MAGN